MTDTFSSLGVSMDKKDPYAAFVRQHVCAVLSLAVGVSRHRQRLSNTTLYCIDQVEDKLQQRVVKRKA